MGTVSAQPARPSDFASQFPKASIGSPPPRGQNTIAMPVPRTARDYLQCTRASQLVADAVMDRYEQADWTGQTVEDAARLLVADGHLTLFQANYILKGRYKNFFFGKYKVLAPIGSGGASQVFLCEHSVMRHRVAVKMLKLHAKSDPGTLERFKREARAAAAVNHPNVVRAYDFDLAEGRHYYIVMDYVDGVNLEDLVARIGPLPPERAVNYVLQAAVGLQHIHECGLVHRDIKPGNLLLDRTGVVRILDLGLVRFADTESDGLTRMQNDHVVLGTADYLSPEQALKSDDLDIRSDLYSLGVTLYFLLAGRAPFADLNVAQKLLFHQFKEPPPLEHVPPDLFAVIRTLMAKKPEDRYQTPAEFAEAVAAWGRVNVPPPAESEIPVVLAPTASPSNVPRALTGPILPPSLIVPPSPGPAQVKSPLPVSVWIAVGVLAVAIVAAVAIILSR
jgi:serine/threonine protein kinase